MKYQLVLQVPTSSRKEFDQMVALEEALAVELGPTAVVDGHDAGAGEVNIFILTDDPARVFDKIWPRVGATSLGSQMRVAYREIGANEFKILYPPNLDRFVVC